MVKRKLKKITAFVLAFCMVGSLPDYSLMTVYADTSTTVSIDDDDKDVFVAENADKETTDMPNSTTVDFTISDAPDTGAYLAFSDGSESYSDGYVTVDIDNSANTITMTGASRGLVSALTFYVYDTSTSSAISGATDSLDIYVCRCFDSDNVTVTAGSVTYTGSAIVPSFTITDNTESTTLVESSHYTVLSSAANVSDDDGTTYDRTTAGTQKVVIRAVNEGLYYGDYTAEYTISQKDLAEAIAATTTTWSDDGVLEYTGSSIEPTSTDGDAEEYFTISGLTEGTDYEITGYSSNLSVGTATVTLSGLGNYTGTATIDFSIVKDLSSTAISVSFSGIDDTDITYDGAEHILTPTVRNNTDSNTVLEEGTDYTLTYEDESGTSYAYDSATDSYLDGSGNAYDFTNVGTKTAVVTAIGSSYYINSTSLSYSIVSKDIEDCIAVTELPTQVNNSTFLAGTVDGLTITEDGTTSGTALTQDTDYTVTVTVDTDANTADIVVTGINNYTGSYTFSDVAIGIDISTATVTLYSDDGTTDYPYEKGGVEPSFDVTYGTSDLVMGTDYTATFSDNTEIGTATLTIQGAGDYAGTLTQTFEIIEGDLSDDSVTVAMDDDYLIKGTGTIYFNGVYSDDASYAGTGAITPIMSVTQNDTALEENTDFTVTASYSLTSGYASLGDSTQIGIYTVTLTGINNYAGSTWTKNYKVYKTSLDNTTTMSLSLGGTSFAYTGSDIVLTPTSGSTKKITVEQIGSDDNTIELTEDTDYVISYLDSDGDEYTLDSNSTSSTYGEYVNSAGDTYDFASVGTKYIKFTGAGAYCGTTTLSYTISGISIAKGTFSISDKEYTGSEVELDGTEFTATLSGNTLTYGTDFEIVDGTYSNNVDYGNGTASVTVQGIGNYNGTKTVYFYIKKNISDSDITVSYTSSYTYTGEAIEPTVTVEDDGTTLTEDEDYTVSYSNNTDVGTAAEIIITGAGESYTSSRTDYFTITAYTLSDIDDENITYDDTFSYTYDGTEKEPTLSDLSFEFAGSEPTSGTYTLTYTDNVDAGTAYAIFTPNSSSDLSGSVAIPFTIEAKEFDANMTVALGGAYTSTTYTYTGKERKLSKNYITVTDDTLSTDLTSGTDFTLSYLNDVDAGSSSVNELYDSTATYSGPIAVITGTGNYSGTWYLGYTINQYDIGTSTFTTVADSTTLYYDGTEKQPSVTVRISSGALTADEDYTITYSDNVNAGTGTYEIDLSTTGNFTDSTTSSTDASYLIVSGSFTIEPRPLSDITIDGLSSKTVSGTTYYYLENQEENDDGSAVIPTLDAYYEISSSSTLDLTLTTDYAVTAYGNNTSVNSNDVAEEDVALNTSDYPYITISGDSGTSGNYTGDLTLYFNIRQGISADWADSWEWADNAVLSYSTLSGYSTIYAADNDMKVMSFTGQVIEPDVTVTYGGTTTELTLNEDYTLVYDDDINCKDSSGNVIEHTATITGIGDYGGSETLSFYIFPLTLPTEAAIASTSYDSSTMYKTYDGYPCNYFTIEGTSVSFIGASSVDVTDMFGTTILFYPNGDALTNSGSAETYDVVSNGNIENFTADLSSSSGTVSASTGLKDAMVHNFKLPTASAYTVTLSIGARSLGDTSSYESYISVDDIDSQIYTGEHISLSGEVNVYDKYRTSTGTYNTTSRTSDFYELEEGTDYVLYYSETAESASAVQEVGTNTIYIVGTGDYTGTISKTYTVVSSIATGSVSIEESTYSGEEQSPAMIVTVNGEVLTADTDYTYEVFDGTTSMGTTATDAGDYTVVITGIGDYETNSSTTLSRTWTIGTLGIDTSDISIRNISSSYTYDGSTVYQPVPIVYFGSTLLTVNTDYTLTYSVTSLDDTSGTEYVSPGTYTVEVAGMGNFGASKTYTYVIGDNFIEGTDDDEIVVTIDNTTLTYDSTDRTDDFGITVALGDGTELTLGTDYEYQILDTDGNLPINAGDYTVYISGLNSYAGLIEKSVTIDPEDITALTLSDVEDEFTYDGTEKEPTPDVTWNGSDATSLIGTDFNYYYYNNVDATEALSLATVTLVPSSNGNFTADNGDFTPVTFEIAPRSITDNDDIEITVTTNSSGNVYLQYSGTTPGVTVVDNGITVSGSAYTMVASTDYTVAFSNNTTVSTTDSTAVVTVTGTGNYTGEKSTTFYIEKYPMSDTTVSCTDGDSFSFTGYEIEPDLTVTDEDGTALVLDQDYTVEYTDNVDVGQATATLTATDDGRFEGTTTVNFDIEAVDLNATSITIATIENQLAGVTPEVTITLTNSDSTTYTLVQDTDFTVTASGNSAVTVDSTAYATATITGIGNFTGTVTENFEVGYDINEYLTAELDETTFEYDGTEKKPGVTVTMLTSTTLTEAEYDSNGDYVSGDYKIVYDDDCISVGTHTVEVVGVGDYGGSYDGTTLEYTITSYDITDSVTAAVVGTINSSGEVEESTLTFTGEVINPDIVITISIDGTTYNLIQGTDFTVTYDDTSSTDAGTYTYSVTGIGNYTGTAGSYEYTIEPKEITSNVVITLTDSYTAYTGSELTPAFTIVDQARDTNGTIYTTTDTGYYSLTTSDYEIEATDNTYPGTGSMTINGIGNYTGSTDEYSFEIVADCSTDLVIEEIEDQAYTGDEITPEPAVTIGDNTLESGTDFTYSYEDNVDVGTATITVTPVDTDHYLNTASTTFDIAYSLSDATMTLPNNDATSYYYTGSAIAFTTANPVVVTYDGVTLTAGTHYTLTYTNNTNVGTATVTATAVDGSGYTGSISRQFTIVKKSLSSSSASMSLSKTSFSYTGSAITVADYVTVTYGSTTLTNGTHYTLSYKNNTSAGTATVTATGKGIYTGSISKTYTIKATSTNINACTVSWDTTVTYTGKATSPSVTVKKGSTTLKKGTDYTIKYVNNVNPGVASIRITGSGNYTSVKTVPYKIEVPDMGTVKVKKTTSSTVKLSWSALSNVTGYVVYDASDLTTKLATFKSAGGTVKNLSAGKKYNFVVRAYVTSNGSQKFGSFSSKTTAVTKPKTPSISLSAGSKKITVKWKKVSSATGYVVYRSTKKNGTYKKIKTITKKSTLKYKNTGLKSGKKYYYKVRAYKTINGKKYYSSYSKVKSVKAK